MWNVMGTYIALTSGTALHCYTTNERGVSLGGGMFGRLGCSLHCGFLFVWEKACIVVYHITADLDLIDDHICTGFDFYWLMKR